ncbi:MAG: three-Cys-motif partner protein TcmP [Lentisphaerota bacterium]
MSNSGFHEKSFDDGTLCKLEMYRKYLRAWLPTFINNPYIDTIQIFDFFAGPGYDGEDNPGSPIIASQEIRIALDGGVCRAGMKVKLFLNELDKNKYKALQTNAAVIRDANPEIDVITDNREFSEVFFDNLPVMSRLRVANFLFLDQFGVSEITQRVFESMINLDKTDFIFFISAAIINRVKEHPDIVKYIPPISKDDWQRMTGNNVNRILSDAYQQWIPVNKNYYLGNFSIKKGANVYGLIFGSGHPFGIHKFLHVAWEKGGDANFDIDGDKIDENQPVLFDFLNKPTKITEFEHAFEAKVLQRELVNNKQVYIFSLQHGVLASHARDALKNMCKDGKLPNQCFHISYDAWKKNGDEPIIYNGEEGKQ